MITKPELPRQNCAAMAVGGPTMVLDPGALRIVSDPTFDAPAREVIGFVLSGANLPTIYLSGDNASIRTSAKIAQRIPDVDVAVLHAGAARVPGKFRDRPVSMDSIRIAAAAAVLGASVVIPAPPRQIGPLHRRAR